MFLKVLLSVFTLILVSDTFARDYGAYMERLSGSDLLDLRHLCDSPTPIWTFSTAAEQKPLLTNRAPEDCRHRLQHNSFFWAPIKNERIDRSRASLDHFVYHRATEGILMHSPNATEEEEEIQPLGKVFYKYLVEISENDQLNSIQLRPKSVPDKQQSQQTKKRVCLDFEGPVMRRTFRRRKIFRRTFDLCLKTRISPTKTSRWLAIVTIPVKSGQIEASIVVPAEIHAISKPKSFSTPLL
ncbi:uncharacterized protein LOC132255742 [Phlebotomus argentipes]|uniref:uncharacterized protein LOC132255742 n=1 Tax=Phlebotomus argentipes TaxID=94469 RepID=UPI002892DFD6|nr:uncharacterized protein LOC132255742 [Phlebotomus argentipes]